MPNIAAVLKSEIARIARKEIRAEIDSLKKAVAAHRADLAALKKRNLALEKALRAQQRSNGKAVPAPAAEGDSPTRLRFSAKRLAAQRQRMGLSAAEFGLLVGVTGQSIYKWEAGEVRPVPKYIAAIAALRHAGKREVSERLAQLKQAN